MSDLKSFSTEKLLEEIERRKSLPIRPKPRNFATQLTGLSDLIAACEDCLNDPQDEYCSHAVYECAMGLVYGKEVWSYLRSVLG